MDEATYSLPRRLPAHCLHWTSHPSFHSRHFCSGHAYVLVFCWHPELLRFAHASGPRSGATSVCHKSAGLSISSFSLARNHIPGSVFFRIQAFAEATTTIKQLSSRMLRGCSIFQETIGNRCRTAGPGQRSLDGLSTHKETPVSLAKRSTPIGIPGRGSQHDPEWRKAIDSLTATRHSSVQIFLSLEQPRAALRPQTITTHYLRGTTHVPPL